MSSSDCGVRGVSGESEVSIGLNVRRIGVRESTTSSSSNASTSSKSNPSRLSNPVCPRRFELDSGAKLRGHKPVSTLESSSKRLILEVLGDGGSGMFTGSVSTKVDGLGFGADAGGKIRNCIEALVSRGGD